MNGNDTYTKQLKQGRIYARRKVYQDRLAFAKDAVRVFNETCDRYYLSLSFGKQSLCLAFMVYSEFPGTPMFFLASEESWLIHDYVEVIDAFMQKHPIRLTIVQTRHAGIDIEPYIERMRQLQPAIQWHFVGTPDTRHSWKSYRDTGDKDLQEMCDRRDWSGWLWGLTKEESRPRRITLSYRWEGQPHPTIFRYTDGKYRCCPLMNWNINDLAAYIDTHKLPMLSEYRRFGLTHRTTARATKMMVTEAGIAWLRRRNRDGYNRLISRFPELKSYT